MTTIHDAGGDFRGYDLRQRPHVLDELTTDYIEPLIMQYFNKTRARQTVGTSVR